VVGVVELAAIVEVEVEITVVMEEGVVLRRGSLVLAPSEEKITVVLVPPFGTNFTPTVWRPPRGRTHSYKVPSVTKGSSHAAMVARVGKGKDYMTLRSGASLSRFFLLSACVLSKKKLSAPTLLIYSAKFYSEASWKMKILS
jgi:hypothetical protein